MRFALLVIAALLALCEDDHRGAAASPFGAAHQAPRDVQLYVHVEDAANLRREVGERPIAGWIRSRLADGAIVSAWDALAREAELEPEALFDLALGNRFTVLVRHDANREAMAPDSARSTWSLLSSVPTVECRRLLREWRAKSLGPRHGLTVHELPEHEIVLAAGSDLLVAGPIDDRSLFDDVLQCLESPRPGRTLDGDAAILQAAELGTGRVGLFARHVQPLGGWSAIVTELQGSEVSIRHSARFDHPPFASPPATTCFELAPIDALQEHAIVAIAEPAENSDGLLGTFLALRFPFMTPELHVRVGGRRLLVLGESDGRRLDPPEDVLVPSIGWCYELKDADGAVVAVDSAMLSLIERLNDAGEGAYHIASPSLKAADGSPRCANVGPAAQTLLRGLPVSDHVSLNWQVTSGGQGDWFVIASDPHLLLDVTRALEADRPVNATSTKAAWSSAGVVHGPRVARHVRTWANLPGLIADDAEQLAEFREIVEPLADLGDCLRTTRWCLTRPTVHTMRLDLSIVLADRGSTQPDSNAR